MKKHEGYTLVEMVISIAVGLVVILVIYAAVNIAQRSTVNVERKVAAHQDARAALQLMSLEIQMASYNPADAPSIWRDPAACTAVSGNQNYRGIQAATASTMTIEADVNDNSAVGGSGNPNEIITYNYDVANQYITRATNCGGNQPFLGDMPGDPRAVRVINTTAVPVFRYYNAQGTEITSGELPAGIPNIARIDITVWVETEDIDPNSGQRRRTVYSTSVIPRNHRL
jgi:prepilin-type N-terminal cleavage/methylation domain-containing protein